MNTTYEMIRWIRITYTFIEYVYQRIRMYNKIKMKRFHSQMKLLQGLRRLFIIINKSHQG